MSQLMTLPATATQEDFSGQVFSELLHLLLHSAGTDLSRPWDHTTTRTKNTINRAERPAHRTQETANEISEQVKYELQHNVPTASISPASTDADLVEHAAAGNERAFELLVQRYEMLIKQFVYRHLTPSEDVQDIVQFVFLQLYLFLPRLRGHLVSVRSQQPLKSWLLQVARNRCRDELRKKHLFLFSEMETTAEDESNPLEYIPDTAPLPEDSVEESDRQRLLQDAIQALPSRYRAIVSLRYQEDLTFREIADRLHIPANTAKTYFQRARPLLRAALGSLQESF
jgi:RNA polymerase sigma-70 factor (ECF subfamily)